MAQYRYTGPDPVTDEQGEAVHPLDVRDFGEPPAWGPWELIPEPEEEPPAPAPAPTVTPLALPPATEQEM